MRFYKCFLDIFKFLSKCTKAKSFKGEIFSFCRLKTIINGKFYKKEAAENSAAYIIY